MKRLSNPIYSRPRETSLPPFLCLGLGVTINVEECRGHWAGYTEEGLTWPAA